MAVVSFRAGSAPANGTIHVIGAGIAGLAAATRLASQGCRVVVSEAAPQAGGRCRSYFDPDLGITIDNGNHLVLSGNRAIHDYLILIGASGRLTGPDHAHLPFADCASGARWTIRPNGGRLPWWLLMPSRRVPGTRLGNYLALTRLLKAGSGQTVGDVIKTTGPLWQRLLEPFLVAALNTDPLDASAMLAGHVIRESLAKGGDAYCPRIAEPTLDAALITPAVDYLTAQGGQIRLSRRLRALHTHGKRVSALDWGDEVIALGPQDRVVLAVPAWVAADLLPELTVPDQHRAIINAHFKVTPPAGLPPLIGVINGTVEWIFAFKDRLSVTISNADRLIGEARESLARRLWAEVAQIHGLTADLPPWQIVKEKRATFAATPEQNRRRPGAITAWSNLALAGDWTATGLPATLEGAVRSGNTAADIALQYGQAL